MNPGVNHRKKVTNMSLEIPFSLFELKRAILNVKQSAPGNDDVCSMLSHMEDSALYAVLKLFNKIWDYGKIAAEWKQSIIIPILKPGKDASDPTNYRPIALTSQLGKTIKKKKKVMERITYYKKITEINKKTEN